MSNKEFEDISIPKWKLSLDGEVKKSYRVYKTKSEFTVVEAESATEAVAKSGFEKVVMVKIGARDEATTLDRSMLFADSAPMQPVVG